MMPAINRQNQNDKSKGNSFTSKPGSFLSDVISVGDIADDYLKMLIYGGNRVGKTTLACEGEKPLLLVSFEPNKMGGAKSVKKVPGVSYYRITSKGQKNHKGEIQKDHARLVADRFVAELRQNNPFKTVVLDSATSYSDLILQEILDLPAVPEQLNWGAIDMEAYRERSEKSRDALRPWMNLDCHVIALAKEKDHNPPKENRNRLTRGLQTESFIAASLGGGTVDWLHDTCDYICRLYVAKETRIVKVKQGNEVTEVEEETGRIIRRLLTTLQPNFAAGFRSENPLSVPDFIEAHTPKEMFSKIMKVSKGEKI